MRNYLKEKEISRLESDVYNWLSKKYSDKKKEFNKLPNGDIGKDKLEKEARALFTVMVMIQDSFGRTTGKWCTYGDYYKEYKSNWFKDFWRFVRAIFKIDKH